MMSLAVPFTASADNTTETSASVAGIRSNPNYYQDQVERFEKMQNKQIDVTINHGGYCIAKAVKLYGREAVGVDNNGNFILGPWHCLDNRTYVDDMDDRTFKLPGTFVEFAFSLDIMWGTDWPYSDVFWNDYDTNVDNIYICFSGMCRKVSVDIQVNGKIVFYDWNCPSHKEWIMPEENANERAYLLYWD